AASNSSIGGKEAEDFAHYAVCLIGLEEELCMCGAVKNDQLLGLGSYFVIRANPGEPWTIATFVIASHDEQRGAFELFSRAIRVGAKEYHTIDLAGPRSDRCVARGSSSHAASNDRYRLRT